MYPVVSGVKTKHKKYHKMIIHKCMGFFFYETVHLCIYSTEVVNYKTVFISPLTLNREMFIKLKIQTSK